MEKTLSNIDSLKALTENARDFVDSALKVAPGQTAPQVKGAMLHVGAMPPEVVRWLAKNKIEPQSAVISITDKALIHATRDIKEHPLPPKFWKTLPQRLKNPKAILFDTTSEQKGNREDKRLSLLWVINLGGKAKKEGKAGKAAIHIDYTTKVRALNGKANEKAITNMVVTGSVVDESAVFDKNKYIKINGTTK